MDTVIGIGLALAFIFVINFGLMVSRIEEIAKEMKARNKIERANMELYALEMKERDISKSDVDKIIYRAW